MKNNIFSFCLRATKFIFYKFSKYSRVYAKRFKGLAEKEKCLILEHQFKSALGYDLNLDNPKTFNEKIQWLKLYYRNPLLTKCADKVAVRDYVKEKIGEEYLIPIIGVFDRIEDINWDSLPNQFVAKVNWGSGQNIICKNKKTFNLNNAKKKLSKWLHPKSNHYYPFLEWCYKDIPPKIIIEKYIEQMDGYLVDYKVHIYNGKPYLVQIIDRWESHKETIYTIEDWQKTDLHFTYDLLEKDFRKTEIINKIYNLSKILGYAFPYVRADFYDIEGRIYFGELTFYPGAGYLSMPKEWDLKLGEMINLESLDYSGRSRQIKSK